MKLLLLSAFIACLSSMGFAKGIDLGMSTWQSCVPQIIDSDTFGRNIGNEFSLQITDNKAELTVIDSRNQKCGFSLVDNKIRQFCNKPRIVSHSYKTDLKMLSDSADSNGFVDIYQLVNFQDETGISVSVEVNDNFVLQVMTKMPDSKAYVATLFYKEKNNTLKQIVLCKAP